MRGVVAGLGGPAKTRAVIYLGAFAVFGSLAVAGVMTLDEADRWFTLAGGALGMGTMGLSLKNLQKAPDVIDEAGRSAVAPDPGLRQVLDAVEGLVRRVELAGGSVSVPASDDSVLAQRLALEARTDSRVE